MTSASYTKLKDGSWGVRVPGKATDGQQITVRKKDGSTKPETIKTVLWTGKDRDGAEVSLCSLAGGNSGSKANRNECVNCGARLSDYAIRRGFKRCLECADGGGNAHGGQSYYDRNGNFVLGDDD